MTNDPLSGSTRAASDRTTMHPERNRRSSGIHRINRIMGLLAFRLIAARSVTEASVQHPWHEARSGSDRKLSNQAPSGRSVRSRQPHLHLCRIGDSHRVTDQILCCGAIEHRAATGIEAGSMERTLHLTVLHGGPDHRCSQVRTTIIEDGNSCALAHRHQTPTSDRIEERFLILDLSHRADTIPLQILSSRVQRKVTGGVTHRRDCLQRRDRWSRGYFSLWGPSGESKFPLLGARSSLPFRNPDNLHPCERRCQSPSHRPLR